MIEKSPPICEHRHSHTDKLIVLVVDDCRDSVNQLEYLLEDEGYEVFSASSGEEAIPKAQVLEPDIILLDLKMPGMGGVEALKSLKFQTSTGNIPIIIVSASEQDLDIVRTLDLGAHDYVAKPYSGMVLSARIRTALRCRKQIKTRNKE